MLLIISVSFIICLSYFFLIIVFSVGWKRIFSYESKGIESSDITVTVVVACKNEQENIFSLIANLSLQSYQDFEFIIVNDHSEDATRNYIKTAQETYSKVQLIDAVGFGKKNAIKEGILRAKGDLILTTDADCLLSFHWIESILSFQLRFPSDLIICPVNISHEYTLFSKLQTLEFASLVGAAAGSAGMKMPVLCNAANMAFKKSVWVECQSELHDEEASGDDMFLLESIKRKKGKIRFLKSEAAFARTKYSKSLSDFIKQRRRWASKSKAYTDWQIIFTACAVFAISSLIVLLLVMSFFEWEYLLALASVFIFKYVLDTYFLYLVRRFFQLDHVWVYSFLLSVVYPFYIVFVALSSFIRKPLKWK